MIIFSQKKKYLQKFHLRLLGSVYNMVLKFLNDYNLVNSLTIYFRYERFKDNAQQDSAELLRCLLDGIRKEEIEVNCATRL